jgi:hypothetical protein
LLLNCRTQATLLRSVRNKSFLVFRTLLCQSIPRSIPAKAQLHISLWLIPPPALSVIYTSQLLPWSKNSFLCFSSIWYSSDISYCLVLKLLGNYRTFQNYVLFSTWAEYTCTSVCTIGMLCNHISEKRTQRLSNIVFFTKLNCYYFQIHIISIRGARSSVVIKALYFKPGGHGFQTRWGELFFFSIYLILPAALGPRVYSGSNRIEYQKQKKYVSVE